eukprot:2278607-Pyramimonas_sp.AAC.1
MGENGRRRVERKCPSHTPTGSADFDYEGEDGSDDDHAGDDDDADDDDGDDDDDDDNDDDDDD